MNLQDCVRDHRLDRQIELVREHWTSVRHFWLDAPGGPRIRSDLPDDFMLGCGMPGLRTACTRRCTEVKRNSRSAPFVGRIVRQSIDAHFAKEAAP